MLQDAAGAFLDVTSSDGCAAYKFEDSNKFEDSTILLASSGDTEV